MTEPKKTTKTVEEVTQVKAKRTSKHVVDTYVEDGVTIQVIRPNEPPKRPTAN